MVTTAQPTQNRARSGKCLEAVRNPDQSRPIRICRKERAGSTYLKAGSLSAVVLIADLPALREPLLAEFIAKGYQAAFQAREIEVLSLRVHGPVGDLG